MYFLKILMINFLTVFFANYILPGIEMSSHTKLPHVGSDFIFAFALGLLNSLIFLMLKMANQGSSIVKMGLFSLVLNFVAYALVKILPIGIHVTSIEGYLLVSLVVAIGSFVTNFLEMKRFTKEHVG